MAYQKSLKNWCILLPMTDTTTPANAVINEVTNMAQFAGKLVYIIEDDVFLGKVLGQKIEESGMVQKRFLNAEDAIETLKTEIPHLILLDIFLPGMNGLKGLEILRGDENTKDIPVIVISNTDEAKHRETALELGAMFLIKAATTPDEIIGHVFDTLKSKTA